MGETLKSPDQVYPDTDTRVLANAGIYILAIVGGDLQLLLNGPRPQPYWSVTTDLGFRGDLSKVKYVGKSLQSTEISSTSRDDCILGSLRIEFAFLQRKLTMRLKELGCSPRPGSWCTELRFRRGCRTTERTGTLASISMAI